ncbi:hypothetical protein AWC01_14795 [Mycobacterium doricum]|uniref:Uncharacterized protein n=2 Tax=Mycolicibacterium doricum TaxID=126673 RepID=A0A1X1T0Z1_9MYCO|nr:hypothetical protein AWC01_14795 [Mycolicibacterium doricum]
MSGRESKDFLDRPLDASDGVLDSPIDVLIAICPYVVARPVFSCRSCPAGKQVRKFWAAFEFA